MARADGDEWLTKRPIVSDDGREDLDRVRSPKWWLRCVACAVLIGLGYAAASALFGGDPISLSDAVAPALVSFGAVATVTVLSAWNARKD